MPKHRAGTAQEPQVTVKKGGKLVCFASCLKFYSSHPTCRQHSKLIWVKTIQVIFTILKRSAVLKEVLWVIECPLPETQSCSGRPGVGGTQESQIGNELCVAYLEGWKETLGIFYHKQTWGWFSAHLFQHQACSSAEITLICIGKARWPHAPFLFRREFSLPWQLSSWPAEKFQRMKSAQDSQFWLTVCRGRASGETSGGLWGSPPQFSLFFPYQPIQTNWKHFIFININTAARRILNAHDLRWLFVPFHHK